MKTREFIARLRTDKRMRMAALVLVAFAVFSYLYSRGISPRMGSGSHCLLQGILQVPI